MQEIKNLAKDSRIAIYGAGKFGVLIKDYIQQNRSDIKIVCFFDKIVQNDIDGIKVHNIKDIKNFSDAFDFIIIASAANFYIMKTILQYYGIQNYIGINNIEDLSQNTSTETEELKQVKKILSPESQKLFELIINSRTCQNCFARLKDYLKFENTKNEHIQYLDFINKEEINTVISGGAHDAGTSILFLNEFKNIEKIYAFEPLYEQFKCEANDEIITKSGKVEIIQKALFNESAEVSFVTSSTWSKIDKDQQKDTYGNTNIQAVSIDEFVREKNIEKVDFIKMDIEGSELPALEGAKNTIQLHRPQLAICIYHGYSSLFEIPLYISSILKDYKFEVYHYSLTNTCESVFYAIPNELL